MNLDLFLSHPKSNVKSQGLKYLWHLYVSMFVGVGAGGTTGNIGRTFYETFDDVVEQFVNSFQSVEYE